LVEYQKYKGKDISEGSILPVNSEIDLVVGKGGAESDAEVPNVIGMSYEEAASALRTSSFGLGFVVFDRSVQTASDSSRAQVWKQNPESTDLSIKSGSKVDIWLSNDKTKRGDAVN
jgi:beta-lactam-binding protein with PASTA domain